MRIFKILSLSLLLILTKFNVFAAGAKASLALKKVMITQITSHPSLDLIVKGVVQELEKNGCVLANITVKNAQGNITTATQIAQKMASDQPDIIIAISTPSAQTAQKALQGMSIPLVFGGVTDPLGAKLVKNLPQPENLTTGTIDLPEADDQVDLMLKFIPNLKTVGLIYNPSEPNTVYQLDLLKAALAKKHLKFVEATAAKTSDVKTVTLSILSDIQAIFIANDNTVVSALQPLLKAAEEANIPVFASDPESVEKGALAALANDQEEVGRATGSVAVQILKGVNPASIPIQQLKTAKIYTNQKTKQKLSL